MYYGRKMRIDDPNLFFVSFYDTSERHFFYRGERASPKLLFFAIYKFFFCRKMPIIRLFVYPIKGAHGGIKPAPRQGA